MVGADGLGDPMSDPLGDALGDPNADAAAELDGWDAAPPVLLEETHPTTVTIATKATGGAAILKGVLRQNGSGRLVLVPTLSPPSHVPHPGAAPAPLHSRKHRATIGGSRKQSV
jgi:hypothetical protein